jgi:putative ABC transport system permease protein
VSEHLRRSLAVAQVGLAVLLVIASGLLIRSLWALSSIDPGFRSAQVVTARISPGASLCDDTARCLAFYQRLEQDVRAIPGVSGAALVSTLPLGGRVAKRSLQLEDFEGGAESAPLFWLNAVTADYFRVMDIPILAGRGLTAADVAGGPRVALIAEAAARRFWPEEPAVGKQIRFVGETEWRTIVGVAADVRAYDLTRDVPAWITGTIYVPYTAAATHEDGRIPEEMTLLVQTATDGSLGTTLRGVTAALSREVAVSDVRPMRQYLSDAVAAPASTTWLFVIFGGLALVLGSIGVYGVVSFLVSRRTREIGVRVALGASPAAVAWMVLREGAKVGAIGTACGSAAAFALSRSLANQLYGVSPSDPATYLGVAVVVSVVTLLACYVPMRRATAVDPLVALRE